MEKYTYLQDSSFLKYFDELRLKEQYVRVTALDMNDKPLKDVEGRVISDSFNLDGNSAVRRTGNVSLIAENEHNDLTDIDNLFSMNKRVNILIGYKNTTDYYKDYPIIWFPKGIYIIVGASLSHELTGVSISLQLKDKMVLLNGECGGVFPAAVTLSEMEIENEDGSIRVEYPTIYQIIQEVVHHFGGEQLGKIIISDIDLRVKAVQQWTGTYPLYSFYYLEDGATQYYYDTNYKNIKAEYDNIYPIAEEGPGIKTYQPGEDIGFINTDFTWSDENSNKQNKGTLTANAGENVCTILDKIKNALGNYEYFYDLNGNFIFQEKKNYLNVSKTKTDISNIVNSDYLFSPNMNKDVYDFTNSNLIISCTNTPQYDNIKNDFIVWGSRNSLDNQKLAIRYHLAIDKKPISFIEVEEGGDDSFQSKYAIMMFYNPETYNNEGALVEKEFYRGSMQDGEWQHNFPEVGRNGIFYFSTDYYYDEEEESGEEYLTNAYIYEDGGYIEYYDNYVYDFLHNEDFSSYLNAKVITHSGEEKILYAIDFGNQSGSPFDLPFNYSDFIDYLFYDSANVQYMQYSEWDPSQGRTVYYNLFKEDGSYWSVEEDLQGYCTNVELQEIGAGIPIYGCQYYNPQENINKCEKDATHRKEVEFEAIEGSSLSESNISIKFIDWRSYLYLQGKQDQYDADNFDLYGSNPYYTELNAEWEKIFDIENNKFYDEYLEHPQDLNYFLDFVDSRETDDISIPSIGRRTLVTTDEKINCLFEPEIPEVFFINSADPDIEDKIEECQNQGQYYFVLNELLYSQLAGGGKYNSAYNVIRDLLAHHTSYNEQITLTIVPIHYLEPNTRIFIDDLASGIKGSYMINSISSSLDYGGTMTINATRIIERL